VQNDDAARVLRLLNYGADPDTFTPLPSHEPEIELPLLYFASPETARLLLEHGADPDISIEDRGSQSLLSVAIGESKWELARVLLEAGADPNRPGNQPGTTPLLIASLRKASSPILSLLLEKGAKADEAWI